MDKPQAKAKVRKRHDQAIRDFQRWLRRNPKADFEKQVQVFDAYIDDSLPRVVRKKSATSKV